MLSRMVALARARHWEQLPALDAQCSTIVDRLQEIGVDAWPMGERAHLRALAKRIRDDQDELTSLVRPQFEQLVRTMADLHPAPGQLLS